MTVDEALTISERLNTAIEVPIGWGAAIHALAAEVRRLREERNLFADAGKAAEDRIVELRELVLFRESEIVTLNNEVLRVAKALDAKEAR